VNFIFSNDDEGRMFASRFQYIADHFGIKITKIIEFEPDTIESRREMILGTLLESTSKVFLLQAKPDDANEILNLADQYNLTTTGNVWILSEEILNRNDLNNDKRTGFLTVRYVEDDEAMLYTLTIIRDSLQDMMYKDIRNRPPSNCSENGLDWSTGKKMYEYVIKGSHRLYDSKVVEFDEDGDRISAKYEIINVQNNNFYTIGQFTTNKSNSHSLQLDLADIVWPGGSKVKPYGTKWSSNFRIVVIEEKPFIFKQLKSPHLTCNEQYNKSIDCPLTRSVNNNTQNETINYCCYGYCIDLIRTLSENLEFNFQLYLVPDGIYGDLDTKTGTWSGLMGEILSDKADMILAPFTVSPERTSFIDFTKPFKYQGITILAKRVRTRFYFYFYL
jgi:hypothetical protein